ncbi:hypothetical protein C1A50_1648 [Paenibacillus polymyxa]|nr:hypothetical protein C1A50_1648 [Paenibacillus polymyxa]
MFKYLATVKNTKKVPRNFPRSFPMTHLDTKKSSHRQYVDNWMVKLVFYMEY